MNINHWLGRAASYILYLSILPRQSTTIIMWCVFWQFTTILMWCVFWQSTTIFDVMCILTIHNKVYFDHPRQFSKWCVFLQSMTIQLHPTRSHWILQTRSATHKIWTHFSRQSNLNSPESAHYSSSEGPPFLYDIVTILSRQSNLDSIEPAN